MTVAVPAVSVLHNYLHSVGNVPIRLPQCIAWQSHQGPGPPSQRRPARSTPKQCCCHLRGKVSLGPARAKRITTQTGGFEWALVKELLVAGRMISCWQKSDNEGSALPGGSWKIAGQGRTGRTGRGARRRWRCTGQERRGAGSTSCECMRVQGNKNQWRRERSSR